MDLLLVWGVRFFGREKVSELDLWEGRLVGNVVVSLLFVDLEFFLFEFVFCKGCVGVCSYDVWKIGVCMKWSEKGVKFCFG